jgi:hypothetical protein
MDSSEKSSSTRKNKASVNKASVTTTSTSSAQELLDTANWPHHHHVHMMDCAHSSIAIAPLIHETQSRQLCAVHALNNLLQLSTMIDKTTDTACRRRTKDCCSNHDDYHDQQEQQVMLCCGTIYRHPFMEPGSIAEFNVIADELTRRETQLYLEKDDGATTTSEEIVDGCHKSSISFWNVMRGHHRTPLLGNYSFEVRRISDVTMF